MAKATTTNPTKPTVTPKAIVKSVWVYVLDAAGVTGLLDQSDNAVGTPIVGRIYYTKEDNTEIASDGSKKLFHSASGIIYPDEVGAVVKAYGVANPPPPADEPDDEPDCFVEPEKKKKPKKPKKKDK